MTIFPVEFKEEVEPAQNRKIQLEKVGGLICINIQADQILQSQEGM